MSSESEETIELAGWGGRPRTVAHLRRVDDPAEVGRALGGPRGALARGLGRSYGDAALNAGGRVLRLDGMTDIGRVGADGTVRVAAGTSLDALQRATLPQGWGLPVVPGTAHVTVGGAIAADVHGKNPGAGTFGSHVVEMDVRTPAGTETVRPGDDLFLATVGGMGLTGVVLAATIRLASVPSTWLRVDTDRTTDLEGAVQLLADAAHTYTVAWLDLRARSGRAVVTRAEPAAPDELPRDADPFAVPAARTITIPDIIAVNAVRPSLMRVYNTLRYHRAPDRERGAIQPRTTVLHPLDGLDRWNRLHGPDGFLQYQFSVPDGGEALLRQIPVALQRAGVPILLTVLKRLGQGAGLLSFPTPGWTLALDIPASPALGRVLDDCDGRVAAAGGRVYLAKDARLRPDVFRRMYPDVDRWQAIRDRVDPDRVLRSDLGRRLDLIGDHHRMSDGSKADA